MARADDGLGVFARGGFGGRASPDAARQELLPMASTRPDV
jgi:hypothetical protein